MSRMTWRWSTKWTIVACVLLAAPLPAWGEGIMLNGIGPVNRSMGGAGTAAPLDAIGSLYWNPASIGGLASSELEFGLEALYANTSISSTAGPFSGSTDSDAGFVPIPSIGWVHKTNDPRMTIGLGLYGFAGFSTNYPASMSNPILTPQPPVGIGVGRVYSEASFMQIAPTISYAVTDQLSIGFAPTVTLGKIAVTPLILGAPDDANGDTLFSYPHGEGGRWTWGLGAQLGVYYITDNFWHLGASIKSPQWFEPYRYNTEDELGLPRRVVFDVELPMVVSVGAAYTGFERWIIATDVRYYDYKNTKGFGGSGFRPDGSLIGLGWSSVFGMAVGGQYQVNEALYARMGYSYNQNPIHSGDSSVNIASPLITQHQLNVGGSYQLTNYLAINFSYTYAFDSTVTGPIVAPGVGPIPGTSVTNYVSAQAADFGVTVRY